MKHIISLMVSQDIMKSKLQKRKEEDHIFYLWGSFDYDVMLFALKNDLVVFSRIVIVSFWDFIHICIEFYMDDCMVYILLKKHKGLLCLIFYHCKQL
jgi:hypothetical protein